MIIDFLLRQQCAVRPWLGLAQGRDVYGEEQTRPCRLQEAPRLEEKSGAESDIDTVRAAAMMFCTGAPIPARSRVRCGEKEYVVLACREAHGLGQAHLEVTLA